MRPIPFFTKRLEQRDLQDYLMAHADALIAGTLDREALARRFGTVDTAQLDAVVTLAERISRVLTETAPSEEFVARLRHELMTSNVFDEDSLVERLRRLTPREQLELVAGIGGATLTAGVFMLLASRPLLDMIGAWRERRTAA